MAIYAKKSTCILTVLLIASALGASAEEQDGNWLLRACKNALKDNTPVTPEEVVGWATGLYCSGFINGMTDMNAVYQKALLSADTGLFCLPSQGLKTDQLIRVVVKFLEDNPEKLHESKRILTVMALSSAFPCSGNEEQAPAKP